MPVQLMSADDRFEVVDDALGVPDGDKETTYTLRSLTREVYRRLAAQHTTKRANRRTHQMEEHIDHEALGEDLLDYVLVDWHGIQLKGEPVSCTREHKCMMDGARGAALLERAGLSRVTPQAVAEDRTESFRGPAAVR